MMMGVQPSCLKNRELTLQQISSLFCCLTSTQCQRFADAEEISQEDIEAVEAEMALKDLRGLAIDDMEKQVIQLSYVGITSVNF